MAVAVVVGVAGVGEPTCSPGCLARVSPSGVWDSVEVMYRAFGRQPAPSKLSPKTEADLRQLRWVRDAV